MSPRFTHHGRSIAGVAVLLVLVAGCSTSGERSAEAPPTTDAPSTTVAGETTTTGADAPSTTTPASSTTPAEPTGGDEDVCAALQRIRDFDTESSDLIDADADWPELQQFFIDTTPGVLAAYDDAIAANSEITEELEILRDFSSQTADIAAEASSLEDFGLRLNDVPGVAEAGTAGLALNEFAMDTCGFATGGN